MEEENHEQELMDWLHETRAVFPKLDDLVIFCDYKEMNAKSLGYVRGKVSHMHDFNAEALLLGEEMTIRKKIVKPPEYEIFINSKLNLKCGKFVDGKHL